MLINTGAFGKGYDRPERLLASGVGGWENPKVLIDPHPRPGCSALSSPWKWGVGTRTVIWVRRERRRER